MATTDPKGASGEVSKTQMLRGVMKDVATLRADLAASLQTIEQISTWAKSTVKPGMQQLQENLDAEIAGVKELNANTEAYARGISGWIKENLGTKLEILDTKIADGIEARQKASEASLWTIFSARLAEASAQFDTYRVAMDQKHKELEEQFIKMKEDLKKSNSLRAKAEQSVKQLEETFARLTRERADEEAIMFRKLTMKLEDERRAIEDERRRMADERKKYKYMLEKHKFELEKSGVTLPTGPTVIAPPNADPSELFDPVFTPTPTSVTETRPPKAISQPLSAAESMKPAYHSVSQWLEAIGFAEYSSSFSEFGYESLHLVALLDEGDLDVMSISKPGHRKSLITAARDLSKARFVKPPEPSATHQTAPSHLPSSSHTQGASIPLNPHAKRPLPKLTKAVSPAMDIFD